MSVGGQGAPPGIDDGGRSEGSPGNRPAADVLIVDDEPANLSLLSTMLADQGHDVRAALSGAMALRTAAAAPPDIILLDVNMPEMDGYEVCRRLKADPRMADIPVVFLSAMSGARDKVTAFEAGGVDYITKPFDLREVLARVGTQLLLHRQRRALAGQRQELEARYLQILKLQGELRGYLSDRAWRTIASTAGEGAPAAPARERLTIVVTDIESFVRLSEEEAPGPLLADLGVYMADLTQAVYEHGGEVDKYLGDGMLAFFKDARGAYAAMREIHRAVSYFNDRQREKGRPAFPTRVGAATGQVLLASIGSSGRREFTIIGDRVNMAFRLQAEAPVGGVLMDSASYEGAGRPAGAEEVVLHVKGKRGAESLYSLEPRVIAAPLG